MSGTAPCYLVQLPAELRTQVFGYLFQDAQIRLVAKGQSSTPIWTLIKHNTNVSILETCKFLRREAAPIFWDIFELFIPSHMIYSLREYGLWSHQEMRKIVSLRSQIMNVNLGFVQSAFDQMTDYTVAISSFVTGLRDYSCLKRLTLTHVCGGAMNSYDVHRLADEELYESLTNREQQELWHRCRPGREIALAAQAEFPFDLHNSDTSCTYQRPTWFLSWMPLYSLIFNWRHDPLKLYISHQGPGQGLSGKTRKRQNISMNFQVFHRHYNQVEYRLKPSDATKQKPEHPLFGVLPPRIHEIEILESESGPTLDMKNMRLVGEHRDFWEHPEPPKHLINMRKLKSLLISYPFWIG